MNKQEKLYVAYMLASFIMFGLIGITVGLNIAGYTRIFNVIFSAIAFITSLVPTVISFDEQAELSSWSKYASITVTCLLFISTIIAIFSL